jgi:hypothetical protein
VAQVQAGIHMKAAFQLIRQAGELSHQDHLPD